MKAINLGKDINGIKKVEELNLDVDENYIPPVSILTNSEIPELKQEFGKDVYLGYDEENDKFVLIYEVGL